MHNLIIDREYDIETPQNSWSFFYFCYVVAFFVSSCAYIIRRLGLELTDLIILAACHIFLMGTLSVILVFGKKKISLLSGWTLTRGLAGLITVYYACFVLVTSIGYFTSEYFESEFLMSDFLYPMILYIIIYFIIVAILVPVALRRRKKILNSPK